MVMEWGLSEKMVSLKSNGLSSCSPLRVGIWGFDAIFKHKGKKKGLLKFSGSHSAVMAIYESYNWLFQWDYTCYKWGFLSTYNWYSSGHNCGSHSGDAWLFFWGDLWWWMEVCLSRWNRRSQRFQELGKNHGGTHQKYMAQMIFEAEVHVQPEENSIFGIRNDDPKLRFFRWKHQVTKREGKFWSLKIWNRLLFFYDVWWCLMGFNGVTVMNIWPT